MDKFLSMPVDGQTNFLVSVSDVIAITRTNDTTTVITYNSSNTATITHATVAPAGREFRDSLQSAMTAALATSWTNVVAAYVPPKVVTDIVIA